MILTNEYLKEQARRYAFDKVGTINDAYFLLHDWFLRDWQPYVGLEFQDAKRKMRAKAMVQAETLERRARGIMTDRRHEDDAARRFKKFGIEPMF